MNKWTRVGLIVAAGIMPGLCVSAVNKRRRAAIARALYQPQSVRRGIEFDPVEFDDFDALEDFEEWCMLTDEERRNMSNAEYAACIDRYWDRVER